jgi:hypothetical protein
MASLSLTVLLIAGAVVVSVMTPVEAKVSA